MDDANRLPEPVELWRLRNASGIVAVARGTTLNDGYLLEIRRGNESIVHEHHGAWEDLLARAEALRGQFTDQRWTGTFGPKV